MAFDAFYSTEAPVGAPPDGGFFDKSTLDLGMDGRVTSVTVDPGSVTKPLVPFDVEFRIDARLASQIVFPFVNTPLIFINATFVSQGGGIDWSMTQFGLGTILNGSFSTPLVIAGVINTLAPVSVAVDELISGANLFILGGDTNLIAALGELNAVLEIRQAIFNFIPGLGIIGADANLFNDNFTFMASGTITPKSNAPFIPEPASALLLGAGLIGLLAAGRRLRK